jgi:hypothetical protein
MDIIDIEKIIKENEELKLKVENMKEYKKNYFQNKTKQKMVYCVCCDSNIKMGSYSNHSKSKKHKDNIKKLNDVEELLEDIEEIIE